MVRRFGKRQIATIVETMAADKNVRVKRPSLVTFLLSGDFARLPVASPAAFRDDKRRAAECEGWEIPIDSLGRKAEHSASTAESIRIWIPKNLDAIAECSLRDAVALSYDKWDGKVRLYRRA